ncbi:hypothetical protein CA13_28090 [Planctomycetes bacterium CA13]|uniref:Wadjet protein JetD C-terminal domain-containing protein n=1 Tax=Novipirellula herctigrandis TaxID=2527986 RepID=A0A5C5Z336_9BACT|nr:hypothetical protein CA13_28090 [Planctomycetes bacterium CA13]
MIKPEQIREKADRLFAKAVKSWLDGELDAFFPYRIPANLTPSMDHATAIAEVDSLRALSKESIGYGYSIVWKSRRSRTHGLNRFPDSIVIETTDDLMQLTSRVDQWHTLQAAASTLRHRQPLLGRWLTQSTNWKTLLEVADHLDGLLSIVDFFITHPRPDCFARELPIPVSTKLIETHQRRLSTWLDIVLPPNAIDARYGYDAFEPRYGLRYARPHYLLRVLDKDLQHELALSFDELSLPAESLSRLPVKEVQVLIIENKVSLLSLPILARTLALGGLGNGVTQLSTINWLSDNEVLYWGDLDADGFVILDRLRRVLPRTQSLLMKEQTVHKFMNLATVGNGAQAKQLEYLTEEERRCYHILCETNTRIEQEHLPIKTVLQSFRNFSAY